MSSQENKTVLDLTHEMFRTGNFDALGEVIAANYIDHNSDPRQLGGPEGVKQQIAMLHSAFHDLSLTVEDMIAEEDKVVARVTMRGTHTGAFLGIPPTGKQVATMSIEIVRYVDSKAVERWSVNDSLGLLQQLGAIPSPR